MSPDQLFAHLTVQGGMFGDAARHAVFADPVPSCPGFDVADLLWHVTVVHHFWGAVVAHRSTAPDEVEQPERPPDSELVARYDDAFATLVSSLADADPSTPVWTPAPPSTVAFVVRRVTHETIVHRCDLDLASDGTPRPIDAALAADGVDEWATVMLRSRPAATLELVADDRERSWTLGDTTALPRAIVHANAPTLLLAVWRRIPTDQLRVDGDPGFAIDFLEHAELIG